jgi:hypothetical protein
MPRTKKPDLRIPVKLTLAQRKLIGQCAPKLGALCRPMQGLAKSDKPKKLAEPYYRLYKRFSPESPEGIKG